MQIVCPNCTTSYAVNPATFGAAGRTVRCARCKEVWHATPESLAPEPRQPAMATGPNEPDEDLSAWGVTAEDDSDMPEVDSPSISTRLPVEAPAVAPPPAEDADWSVMTRQDAEPADAVPAGWRRRVPAMPHLRVGRHALPVATAAMAALTLALMIWRTDVVKLFPQTALFYQGLGLDVNVRGLAFKDVKVSTETVDGKPVMLIEGLIVSETRVPTAMPRLRFVLRDEKGTEIYAWSAVLEQPGLNPGDKAWFKSRLASPPAEGRSLDVRFFNTHDVAGA